VTVTRALGPGSLKKRPLPAGGASWTLDFTDARGRRRRVVLGTDHRVAERRRADLIRKRDLELAGLGGEEGMCMALRELADLHLADLATRVSPHHLRNVRCILDQALAAITAVRVRDLRPYDLLVYRRGLVEEGLSHRWANLAIDRIRAMLSWGERAGLIAKSPIGEMDRLPEGAKHERRRRRAMSDAEIEQFLAAAVEDDQRCAAMFPTPRVPQAPLWRAFLETGARYRELTTACWSDLDLERRILVLRPEATKSGRTRAIPIGDTLVEELRGLAFAHHRVLGRPAEPKDPVFLTPDGCQWPWHSANLRRIFERLLAAAGIADKDEQGRQLDVHALRHTFASRLARNGVGIAHAQRLLGHADPKLTMRAYTHLGVEELREAVEAITKKESRQAPTREAQ
jgi:integrase